MMYKFMSEGLQIDNCYATAAVLMIIVIVLNVAVTLCEWLFKRRSKI